MNKKNMILYIGFAILMFGLGCSDALRGVFAPVFQEHFTLSATNLSTIITISYVGNLVFMLLGGRLADGLGIRRIFTVSLLCWMGAMLLYVLTDSYYALLFGVFFAMGASTLLNMLLNIMSPILFAAPGTIINTLFFIQMMGTTLSQSVIGSLADSIFWWKLVNICMIAMGIIAILIFLPLSAGEEGLKKKVSASKPSDAKKSGGSAATDYLTLVKTPVFWLFILVFGCYFIGEHGVMNWMNIYCQDGLGLSAARASLMPSLFFGGVMVGRLVFAPLVTKFGIRETLLYTMIPGTIVYVITFVVGGSAMYLLLAAGLGFSIVYPTMTMCIQLFFPAEITTTASGTILAIATVFDILFNAVFGSIIDSVGYQMGMMILPVAMVLCLVLYAFMIKTNKPIRMI